MWKFLMWKPPVCPETLTLKNGDFEKKTLEYGIYLRIWVFN